MAWLLGINIAEPTFGVDCDRIGNSMVITTQKSQKKTMHPAVPDWGVVAFVHFVDI